MEDLLLIKEVKKHEILYNTELHCFSNAKERKDIWEAISRTLNTSTHYAFNRWKNLRERFIKTYMRSLCPGNSILVQTKWDLYQHLLFLKDYIPDCNSEEPKRPATIAKIIRPKTIDSCDVELIEEVKKYPSLYTKHHINYFDQKLRKEIWDKISSDLQIDVWMAMKRWRVLRDHFVRDYNRTQAINASTQSEKPVAVWELYEKMLFLKDCIDTNIIIDPNQEAENSKNQKERAWNMPQYLNTHLIQEVRKYKCLLTTTTDPTKRRQIAWMKISAKLKIPAVVLMKKWRYLRNRFLREYNSNSSSTWPFYNQLIFLKDYIKKNDDKVSWDSEKDSDDNLEAEDLCLVDETNEDAKDLQISIDKNKFYAQLINEVKPYEPIYNPAHKNNRNPRYLSDVWEKISKKLEKPISRCRIRWQILRDRFIKEHVFFEKHGHFNEYQWEFYEDLKFLIPFMGNRRDILLQKEIDENGPVPRLPQDFSRKAMKMSQYWIQLDAEKLIQEIRKRPELYKPCYSKINYMKRRSKLWEYIAKKLNSSVRYCKVKWKDLKKRYQSECKKIAKYADDDFKSISLWRHFHQMEFIKPYLRLEGVPNDFKETVDEKICSEDWLDSCEEGFSNDEKETTRNKEEETIEIDLSVDTNEVDGKEKELELVPYTKSSLLSTAYNANEDENHQMFTYSMESEKACMDALMMEDNYFPYLEESFIESDIFALNEEILMDDKENKAPEVKNTEQVYDELEPFDENQSFDNEIPTNGDEGFMTDIIDTFSNGTETKADSNEALEVVPDLEEDLEAVMEMESEEELVKERNSDSDIEPETDLVLEPELDLNLNSDEELDVEPEVEMEEEQDKDFATAIGIEQQIEMVVDPLEEYDLQFGNELYLEPQALETESEAEPKELEVDSETEDEFETGEEVALQLQDETFELIEELEAEPVAAPESDSQIIFHYYNNENFYNFSDPNMLHYKMSCNQYEEEAEQEESEEETQQEDYLEREIEQEAQFEKENAFVYSNQETSCNLYSTKPVMQPSEEIHLTNVDHLPFLQMVVNILNLLPAEELEDVKTFCLDYLKNQLLNYVIKTQQTMT